MVDARVLGQVGDRSSGLAVALLAAHAASVRPPNCRTDPAVSGFCSAAELGGVGHNTSKGSHSQQAWPLAPLRPPVVLSGIGHHPRKGAPPSRRRDCHFAGTPSSSLLKHLLKGERGCSRMPVSPMASPTKLGDRHRTSPRLEIRVDRVPRPWERHCRVAAGSVQQLKPTAGAAVPSFGLQYDVTPSQ